MGISTSFPDAIPALQIVHVTDLHYVVANRRANARVDRLIRLLGHRTPWLSRMLRDGTAPNDPMAEIAFRRFLASITSADPDWWRVPTWLLDTGDQTTFGDAASVAAARAALSGFASAASARRVQVRILGNHDAWPDDLPLLARAKIVRHTRDLGKPPHPFAVRAVQGPMTERLPAGSQVQLYTIDSVDDGARPNFLARGRIDDAEAKLLERKMQRNGAGRPFRIVASHHPVDYPRPRPLFGMAIARGRRWRSEFATMQPAAHLFLSGHTHALSPLHGQLPRSPRAMTDNDLGQDQIQLVAGTLMQEDRFHKRGDHPQQCQVLRILQDPADGARVVVQRLLAARNPGGNPARLHYAFINCPRAQSPIEEIVFML
jgi:Calcineurin-like phosphoesterase